MQNLELFFDWAAPLCADLEAAQTRVVASALSLHAPRHRSGSALARLWLALESAVARGAAVTFYLPAPSRAHPATAMNEQAAGRLRAIGAGAVFVPMPRLLHAKTLAIDDRIAWIGSGNWTAAAITHNHEAYVRADSPRLALALSQYWNDSWQK